MEWMGALAYLEQYPLMRVDEVKPEAGKMLHALSLLRGMIRAVDPYVSEVAEALIAGRLYLFCGEPARPLHCMFPFARWDGASTAFLSPKDSEAIRTLGDPRARWRLNRNVSDEALATYRGAVEDALVDGVITDTEAKTLDRFRTSLGIPKAVAEQLESELVAVASPTEVRREEEEELLQVTGTRQLDAPVRRMATSANGNRLLFALENGTIVLQTPGQARSPLEFSIEGTPRCVELSSSGDRIAVGTWQGLVVLADEEGILWDRQVGSVPEACFLIEQDARTFVVTWEGRLFLLRSTGETISEVELGSQILYADASEQPRLIAVATDAPELCLLSAEAELLRRIPLPELPGGLSVLRDGSAMIVGCQDGSVSSIDRDGNISAIYRESEPVRGLWGAADGEACLVLHGDRRLVFYGARRSQRWSHEVGATVLQGAVAEGGGPAVATTDGPGLVLLDRRRRHYGISLPSIAMDVAVSARGRELRVALADGTMATYVNRRAVAATQGPRIRAIAGCERGLQLHRVNSIQLELENVGDQAAKNLVVTISGRIVHEQREECAELKPGQRTVLKIPLEVDTPGNPPVNFTLNYYPEFEQTQRAQSERILPPVADTDRGESPEPFREELFTGEAD